MFFCMAASQAFVPHNKVGGDTGERDSVQRVCIHLTTDSAKVGNAFVEFRKNGQINYDIDEDGLYSAPIENLKLCSISADGYPLITNVIPYPSSLPEVLKLYICPKDSGAYKMRFDSIKTIPRHVKIMLIDKYLNCSVEVKQNKCYSFNIDKKNLLTYGDNRFMLVIYQNQNYSFQSAAFGIVGHKKKTPAALTPMQVYSTTNSGKIVMANF